MSILRVYNGKGVLQHREGGPDAVLRDEGARFTTTMGQLEWTCKLFIGGKKVATCKRGVWTEVTP